MKTQAIYLPNGMISHVFFTSIAQNDNGLVNISGIEEELERVLEPHKLANNVFPAVYGDEIYFPSTVIVKRNGAEDVFHDRLTSARVDIEHCFGSCNSLFKGLTSKHTWKLCKMQKYVKTHLFSIFFMVNCHSCFRGNKTSIKYGQKTHHINQYLNVSQDDRYDGAEEDEFMIGHFHNIFY